MGLACRLLVCAVLGWISVPVVALAQSATSGSIAGTARDTSGGVLPGVTVEASSPALIERARTAVTDERGQYQITDLRPGIYAVSFTLAGFNTVRHEAIELTSGFTATVNAELKVGALEETITVTGGSPLVDARNTRLQNVISAESLATLPSGKTVQAYGALTLGAIATPDVGGNKGEAPVAIGIRGVPGADMRQLVDGLPVNLAFGTGGGGLRFYIVNSALAEEVALQTGGSAEAETGGVQMNMVPRQGGNTFRTSGWSFFTNSTLQSGNLSDELRQRGLTSGPSVDRIWDYGVGIGGPLRQNRAWFYTGHRWWGAKENQPGAYFNAIPETMFYRADLNRPAYTDLNNEDHSGRITWQATTRNKISGFFSLQNNCNCYNGVSSARAPEAATLADFWPTSLSQVTWSFPASSRLLFDAGFAYVESGRWSRRAPESLPTTIASADVTSGFEWGAYVGATLGTSDYGLNDGTQYPGRFTMSYVTGSHSLRVGTNWSWGRNILNFILNDPPVKYYYRNCFTSVCEPTRVQYIASPHYSKSVLRNYGFHAQDQWTINRLTLNLGVRMDYFHAWNPAQTRPAGPFVAELQVEEIDNVPLWKDINPRLGAAFDVFGNGKTAVRVFLGRYVTGEGASIAQANNPANAIVTTANRTWTDSNRDYIPQDSELGPLDNAAFGTVRINTRYDPDVLEGWRVRGYNWQHTATIQHELRPGLAVNASYFRTWFGNFRVTDNLEQSPGDFDPYCVTAPVDPRLSGSGQQICGLYDITPSRFGISTRGSLVTPAAKFGKQTEVYNGVEFSATARLRSGGSIAGGVNTGRTVTDNCEVNPDAPGRQYCRQMNPWRGQTQFKVNGSYPLPWWGLQGSGVVQVLPGAPQSATRAYTNAEIAPSLGRNLASCPSSTGPCSATANVIVLQPFTQFENRLTQVDLRITKSIVAGKARIQGMLDLYNAFNSNTVLGINATYGSSWLRPTGILGGRLFKLGAQVDF